ncbi:predicted protein [Naegleria gruberi]|uniref:Predicted protein n=1 Tax=Naegleria gruberi TaxID=5762 RepID=D2W674_NAEGR|nr:uncharacterized protein NAEGRDRAFT_76917 [Naegleria gruberi]EFC35428.1 predicted protein [Naegleria gruberi]|eukprot:XP_002668172.1 predicted protein [Naegleria gruberi strain NEG-M]
MSNDQLILLLDQSIGSSQLLDKFRLDHHKQLDIFNLKIKLNETNLKKARGGGGISILLSYGDYIIVEENFGFGQYGLTVYLNDDGNIIRNLQGGNPITKLVHTMYYSVRAMCLESFVDINSQIIDYLIFLSSDQRLYKYNIKEWIENSKSGKETNCIWVKGLRYDSYSEEGFSYGRSVVCVESNGKYSNVRGNLIVVADTDNKRLKLYDSLDGNLLKVVYDFGGVTLGKPMGMIYSKELDLFLIVTREKSFFKCKLSHNLQFETSQLSTTQSIWCLCYEPSSRKVLFPNTNSSLICVMNLESMKVEKEYKGEGTVSSISFDEKYQRFYFLYEGISYMME